MNFCILTEPSQIGEYVEIIQSFADANKRALGFLPKSAFSDHANYGRLWVAVCEKKRDCVGYLMYGGRFPTLRISQLFVSKNHRKHRIGSTLLSKFEAYAEERNYLSINARVAADLESNKFWDKAGYELIKQVEGGKTTNRIINVRIKDLDTPSLLKLMSFKSCGDQRGIESLKTVQRPLFRSSTYVIDLNVFFDVVKQRIDRDNATRLISSGLSNEIKFTLHPNSVKNWNEIRRKSMTQYLNLPNSCRHYRG